VTAAEPAQVAGQLWPTEPEPAAAQAPVWTAPEVVEEQVDYDFDAAWRERKAAERPPTIRVFGTVYRLPNSLPAKLILFAAKAQRDGRGAESKIDPLEAYDLMACLLGRANLDAILSAGLEMDDMPDLLAQCNRIYKARMGNPKAPATTGADPTTSAS
jgi:hypothetical protein